MLNQDDGGTELIIHVQDKATHVLLFFNVHARHWFIKQQH